MTKLLSGAIRIAPKAESWMRRVLATTLAVSVASCVSIGDIGGPGDTLSTQVIDAFRNEAAPIFRAHPIENKIRIGHLGNGCVRWLSRFCIEITAGIEIEQRADLIRIFEERIQDPCALLNAPLSLSIPSSRRSEYREFFDCDNPPGSRAIRFVELQTVSDPTLQKPHIYRVRTYRIPASQ